VVRVAHNGAADGHTVHMVSLQRYAACCWKACITDASPIVMYNNTLKTCAASADTHSYPCAHLLLVCAASLVRTRSRG
jgi:hypothetical protein